MDVRQALRSMWHDTATVTEYEDYARGNGSTGQRGAIAHENEPCKLSFERLAPVAQTESVAVVAQGAKLFIDETIVIKPGSKITVTRKGGKVFEFAQSGMPGAFEHHQEIPLAPYGDYA